MAAHQPQLTRLHIPHQGSPIPPALFAPGLPTALQQSFGMATPLNTNLGPQLPPHPQPRHGMHRAHPSLIFPGSAAALAAAGIALPSGMPVPPGGMPLNMILGMPVFQRGSRRTPSISTGGPPKAPLGGPNRKHSPKPSVSAPALIVAGASEKNKSKKIILKLPVESITKDGDEGDISGVVYSLWSRRPLPHSEVPTMERIQPPETTSIEMHPLEQSITLPPTIDVFLPGKAAWDEYKQKLIEEKLQRLGVEKGCSSAPPGPSLIHGRAASISSPADPALLLFKLNKLHQSQNGSISFSPQPPSASVSPNPQLPPRFQQNSAFRHSHSFSLANYSPTPQVYNPSGAFNPFGPSATLGSDRVLVRQVSPVPPFHAATERDLPPHLHAPQGVVPLSLNMQSETATASSGPSRVASTIPDFNRGFGLDIPEEDEEELEAFAQADVISGVLPVGVQEDLNEIEDDVTTAGAHTRHVSRVSIALSLKSMGGRSGNLDVEDIIEENPPPELENPVEWNMTRPAQDGRIHGDREADRNPVDEWTGSEDDRSLAEFSNPSDEERAIQAKQERQEARARERIYQDHETPRRLPDFPRPPEGPNLIHHAPSTTDDDIVSNPSEEENARERAWLHPGQSQQDLAYYQPVVDGQPRSPRPLPPLPHSRSASGNYSYPSTMHHSRHGSARVNELEMSNAISTTTIRRESLNPFAKPFVFGAASALVVRPGNNDSEAVTAGHMRQPSSGRALNAAAAEFKPGFTFIPPAGVTMLSFPVAEASSRPLPQPPLGVSPSRVQGREKRQRRGSSADGDEDWKDEEDEDEGTRQTMTSFRFPSTSPSAPSTLLRAVSAGASLSERPISPMPQRRSELNAAAPPFKFPGTSTLTLPFTTKEPSSLPYPLVPLPPVKDVTSDTQNDPEPGTEITPKADTNDLASDVPASVEVSPPPTRKRPPVLDFKHPVSMNTVPAALFRRTIMGTDLEGSTRPTVRSRLSSREIFDHMNSQSLDDTHVPTISRKSNIPNPRITAALQNRNDTPIDQPADLFTPLQSGGSQEPRLRVPTSAIASPISESMLSSYTRRREEADQIEQRLEDMLDDRMELAKKDLADANGHASDHIVDQVINAIKTHISELITRQEGTADARGEVDFELNRSTIEQVVLDIRTGLRGDLEEVLRSVGSTHLARERSASSLPADFHRVMEEFGSRTISAVTNAVVKFAARIDQIDELARDRASDERDELLGQIYNALAPRLEALRQPPIDFESVTARLAEAVKPHISQLIDLTSDKKETAGLIVQRLMPTLSALSQTPAHVDTDAIVSQLRVEVARMAPASDPHAIKEAVADLVVERLDSRLALRERPVSSDALYSRISERIDDLHAPVSDVRKAVEDLYMGQESIREQGTTLNTLHQDMAAQLLGLPGAIDSAVAAIHATGERLTTLQSNPSSSNATEFLPHLESIETTVRKLVTNHEYLASQSVSLVTLHEALQASVLSLPKTLEEAIKSLKQSQTELLLRSRSPDQSEGIRMLTASNGELAVQLAKARGAHGQIRVEKDLMFDRMTAAEADCESLRAQVEELKSQGAAKATEATAAGLRIAELEDALSHALARLESSDVTTQAKEERITALERQNHEYSMEEYKFKSQIQKLEMQVEWLTRDKDNLEQRFSQLQRDRDSLANQQSHWEELRRTSEQVEQLTRLIGAADSAEIAELKRTSDRAKVMEGEHASLQKRFKEQEAKLLNIERASQTARQGMAQAQQRASEWEKRTKELEAELDAVRARLDEADETKLQLDSDLSLVKMHLEEKEKSEKDAKEQGANLRAQVSSLESQLSGVKQELERAKSARVLPVVSTSSAVSPSPPRWANGYSSNSPAVRPSSRASTIYGARSPVTPTDVSYRNGKFPSRAPSVAPDSPKGVWGSMHAPRAPTQRVSTNLPYPPRSAIPSPTPSTVSLAPTQGDDGWWS
ncbi:hypothetical protein K439DRAFT_708741 [Ramaria rubella]|nr:hypothetical protein K439DRAFT_708741 [Ramaria rubella]